MYSVVPPPPLELLKTQEIRGARQTLETLPSGSPRDPSPTLRAESSGSPLGLGGTVGCRSSQSRPAGLSSCSPLGTREGELAHNRDDTSIEVLEDFGSLLVRELWPLA